MYGAELSNHTVQSHQPLMNFRGNLFFAFFTKFSIQTQRAEDLNFRQIIEECLTKSKAYKLTGRKSHLNYYFDNDLKLTCTWLAQHLYVTCTWLAHDLHMTCTWFAHDLHMTCTWLAHDLHMTCTWPAHVFQYQTRAISCISLSDINSFNKLW